jgi:hypothetical protein
MKIDQGYCVGERWRFPDGQWSDWEWVYASGCTGLIMIYRNEKTAQRHNTLGIVEERRYGYYTHADPYAYDKDGTWREELAIFETRLFPAKLEVE